MSSQWDVVNFSFKGRREWPETLTFNINLCWCWICAIEVGSEAGVAAGVLLKSLGYDEGVLLSIGDDLDIWTVLQLLPLTEPSEAQQRIVSTHGIRIQRWFTENLIIYLTHLKW